jgi:hypothetical protein
LANKKYEICLKLNKTQDDDSEEDSAAEDAVEVKRKEEKLNITITQINNINFI